MQNKINLFLLDEDVRLCMDWGKENNIFSVLQPGEVKLSRMLAWLLDPREAHLQGDYFIKALIRAAFSESEITKDVFKSWNPIHLEAYSFTNAIVLLEHPIGEGNDRKVDLVILDPANEMAIFIEHKMGSREGQNQTPDYYKELHKSYPAFEQLFIFLDLNASEAEDKHWINLNYSWLEMSLKNLLEREALPVRIEWMLRDYLNYISDDYYLPSAFHEKPYHLLPDVAKNHADVIKNVREAANIVKSTDLISLMEFSSEQHTFQYLYLRHQAFFDALFEYCEWDYWEKEITKRLDHCVQFDRQKNKLYIHLQEWESLYEKECEFWGVQFFLSKQEDGFSLKTEIHPKSFEENISLLVGNKATEIQRKNKLGKRTKNILIYAEEGIDESKLLSKVHDQYEDIIMFLNTCKK